MKYMGLGEVARRLGVDSRRADTVTRRKGFPEPVARLSIGRVWWRADVEQWIRDQSA